MKIYGTKLAQFKVAVETTIVAARNRLGVIGRDNKIPWHSPADLANFKQTTMGMPMVMGRKTFESLPGVLKDRLHVVLTSNSDYPTKDGVVIADSIEDAYQGLVDDFIAAFVSFDEERLKYYSASLDMATWQEIFKVAHRFFREGSALEGEQPLITLRVAIIGGADVYKQALGFADHMVLSEINNEIQGDTHFPVIGNDWWMVSGYPLDNETLYPVVTHWIRRDDAK